MELTFENWLKGEIELNGTYRNKAKPSDDIIINIDLFDNDNKKKIQDAQKVIFSDSVTKLFEKFQEDFTNRFQKSKQKV